MKQKKRAIVKISRTDTAFEVNLEQMKITPIFGFICDEARYFTLDAEGKHYVIAEEDSREADYMNLEGNTNIMLFADKIDAYSELDAFIQLPASLRYNAKVRGIVKKFLNVCYSNYKKIITLTRYNEEINLAYDIARKYMKDDDIDQKSIDSLDSHMIDTGFYKMNDHVITESNDTADIVSLDISPIFQVLAKKADVNLLTSKYLIDNGMMVYRNSPGLLYARLRSCTCKIDIMTLKYAIMSYSDVPLLDISEMQFLVKYCNGTILIVGHYIKYKEEVV